MILTLPKNIDTPMRLTTLARKVGITPSQLISVLEKNKIEVSNGVNTKLDEETVAFVYREFEIAPEVKPDEITEPAIDPAIVEAPETIIEPESIIEEPVIENIEISAEPIATTGNEVRTGTVDDLDTDDASEIELIKVKKVKLEGIKILGKIELPTRPIKSAPVDAEEAGKVVAEPSPKKPRPDYRKPDHKQRHEKKTLSYEERLKRENSAREKERLKKLQEEKERKQRYYEKHIAPKTPKQPAKKQSRVVKSVASQTEPVVHKNPIRRFLAWINGRYDKY